MSWPVANASMQAALTDPLTGSAWSQPGTVSGFVRSAPNLSLIEYAKGDLIEGQSACSLESDAAPAKTRSPWPSSDGTSSARTSRGRCCMLPPSGPYAGDCDSRLPRWTLPIRDRSVDSSSPTVSGTSRERRRVPAQHPEPARVSRPGGAFFVFTFSRSTLPSAAPPVEGESFVYIPPGTAAMFRHGSAAARRAAPGRFSPDARLPLRELAVRRPLIF